MKKTKTFKIIWQYLKDDKIKLLLYIFLVFLSYMPPLFNAYIFGSALEQLINKNFNSFALLLVIWSVIDIIFYSLLQIPRDLLYNSLEIKFTKNVSRDLYKKLDNLPAKAFEEIGTGELVNRIYTDPDRIMELLSKLIRMTSKALIVLFVIGLSFSISFFLGLEIIIFSIIMGFISKFFFPRIKKSQENIKHEADNYVKKITENISGIREIKALGIKKNIEDNVYENIDSLFNQSRKIKKYEVTYYSLNNLIYFLLQGIILLTTGYLFIKGYIAYAVFMVMDNYIFRIDDVVESISDFGVSYNKVTVSLKRIDEIINNKIYPDEKFGNIENIKGKGSIEFKNVKFRYSEDEDYTLKGLNLSIKPNEKTAIIGRSGNGKSTIFNLLLRYFDSNEGQILLDGIDIKDLSEKELRKNISIIRQTPFLFNMSIIDNFRLVKSDVTLKEVRKVCKEAYIDDYIMSLPNKYETIVGEGGINLSGGQKQRLAIARTLLLNTKIILFDEATSALDNESQEYIKKTIDKLVDKHTIIIVAHRLSTIIDADTINVIDKGKLIASGKHDELLKNCKIYNSLYNTESSN